MNKKLIKITINASIILRIINTTTIRRYSLKNLFDYRKSYVKFSIKRYNNNRA